MSKEILALFMIIRNSKVLPTGLKLEKSEEEINKISYETMLQVFNIIDFNKAKEKYIQGKEAYEKED